MIIDDNYSTEWNDRVRNWQRNWRITTICMVHNCLQLATDATQSSCSKYSLAWKNYIQFDNIYKMDMKPWTLERWTRPWIAFIHKHKTIMRTDRQKKKKKQFIKLSGYVFVLKNMDMCVRVRSFITALFISRYHFCCELQTLFLNIYTRTRFTCIVFFFKSATYSIVV